MYQPLTASLKKTKMKTIIIFIFILLTLISCEKNEEMPVLAGDINLEMFHYEFNPALKVQLQIDSVNNRKYGKDSVDIDQDGNYDLFIQQNLFIDWKETDRLDYGTYFGKLVTKNGLEINTKTETYYIGLGQTSDINWVDTIKYEDRIDSRDNWSDPNNTIYKFMWALPSEPTMSNGCWFNILNEEKYIGIRIKINSIYKYGWVKVNQDAERNIEIQSYAIEK
jgi:hypothetical protein